jgi:hypothetical protein
MTKQSHISQRETPRDYRTEIPNIIFNLLEIGEISNSDFILYSVYRKIAGEHGACWMGTRALEIKTNLTDKTIAKSKRNLSRGFKQLGGKSLIEITPCNRQLETADTIVINDIWPENYEYFKNSLTCRKITDRGAGKEGTPVPENNGQKKEPVKKEPLKNVIAKPEPPPSPAEAMPAGGNNNNNLIYKSLEQAYDLSVRQKAELCRKHSEAAVALAVRYCYHPSTQIEGGPVGRLKLILYYLKNPDLFADKMRELERPHEKKSHKETTCGRFKHGEMYNGYEFIVDDIGVGFLKPGAVHQYSIKRGADFGMEFLKLLSKLGIPWNEIKQGD